MYRALCLIYKKGHLIIFPQTQRIQVVYLELFKKLSSVCNDVETSRKISTLLTNIHEVRLLQMDYSSKNLSYEFIEKLTSLSTSFDAIRYFTEHGAKDVHPCNLGEIVLKWWRVREGNCPDTTFVKELFTKIQEIDSDWVDNVKSDCRYKELIRELQLKRPAEQRGFRYFVGRFDDEAYKLKQCIMEGDGSQLLLAEWNLCSTPNMKAYRDNVSPFTYNPSASADPVEGIDAGHWYLVCAYRDDDSNNDGNNNSNDDSNDDIYNDSNNDIYNYNNDDIYNDNNDDNNDDIYNDNNDDSNDDIYNDSNNDGNSDSNDDSNNDGSNDSNDDIYNDSNDDSSYDRNNDSNNDSSDDSNNDGSNDSNEDIYNDRSGDSGDDGINGLIFISFVTDTQQDIVDYFEVISLLSCIMYPHWTALTLNE